MLRIRTRQNGAGLKIQTQSARIGVTQPSESYHKLFQIGCSGGTKTKKFGLEQFQARFFIKVKIVFGRQHQHGIFQALCGRFPILRRLLSNFVQADVFAGNLYHPQSKFISSLSFQACCQAFV